MNQSTALVTSQKPNSRPDSKKSPLPEGDIEGRKEEDFRNKVKAKLQEQVLNGSQFVLLFNLCLPQLVALLVEVFSNYISIYFQVQNFGSGYYPAALVYVSYLFIISKYVTQSIAQRHAMNFAEMVQQNKPKEEIQEIVSSHYKLQVLLGIVMTIIGIAVSFTLTDFPVYSTYVKTCAFFMPFCNAVSASYSIVFMIENRRLLMFGLTVARPILQTFIEVFAYSFFFKATATTTNMPTTIAVAFSHGVVAIWILWFNCGQTAMGVTNLEEFPKINFKDWDWKKMMYSIKLLPAAVNGASQILFLAAVIMVQKDVAKTFTDATAILTMNYKVFVFAVFGQIFRVAAQACCSLYTQMCISNHLAQNFTRINTTKLMLIVFSAVINVLLFFLLSQAPILHIFSNADVHSIDVQSTLLYCALAGFGQTFTEISATQSLVDNMWILIAAVPILKIVQILVIENYLVTTIGDGADYIMMLFFTEMNSTGTGFIIMVIDIIKNIIKNKQKQKKNKAKKEAKKQAGQVGMK